MIEVTFKTLSCCTLHGIYVDAKEKLCISPNDSDEGGGEGANAVEDEDGDSENKDPEGSNFENAGPGDIRGVDNKDCGC